MAGFEFPYCFFSLPAPYRSRILVSQRFPLYSFFTTFSSKEEPRARGLTLRILNKTTITPNTTANERISLRCPSLLLCHYTTLCIHSHGANTGFAPFCYTRWRGSRGGFQIKTKHKWNEARTTNNKGTHHAFSFPLVFRVEEEGKRNKERKKEQKCFFFFKLIFFPLKHLIICKSLSQWSPVARCRLISHATA